MKKSILLGATALLAVGANAQTINYTALQDAFGQPVTTSATGKPQVASDAPASLRIISAADIKASGLDNLPDILNRYSGLDVLRWGTGAADVAIRGYNHGHYGRLLVRVNGRQVFNDHYAMVVWNTIPVALSEIKQIEIVKGPVGAIYGFNAVAGVINIITVNPLYDETGTATLRAGNNDKREANMVKTLKLGDSLGLKLSAGYKEADEFQRGKLTTTERNRLRDMEANHVSAAGLAQVADNIQVGVELSRSYSLQDNYTTTNTYFAIEYVARAAKLDVDVDAGNVGLINFSAYRNWLDFDYLGTGASDARLTVAQISDLIQLNPEHTVKITGEYRKSEMGRWPTPGGRISADIFASSLMWDWKVSDNVSFTNAARVDNFNLGYKGAVPTPRTVSEFDTDLTKFSFNSGVVYKPTPEDTLRFTYGLANQLPAMFELGGFYGAGSVGNPNLKPASISSFELGYDHLLPAINGSFGLSAYRQKTKDVKATTGAASDRVLINGTLTQTFINAGESSSWGVEADIRGAIAGGFTYGASYTWINIDDDLTINKGRLPTRPVYYEKATPTHKLQGNIGWTSGALSADLGMTWQSSRYQLRSGTGADAGFLVPTKIDSYVSGTASVAYTLSTGTEIRATATDFLRASTPATTVLETERRLYLSVSQTF
ncbi:TonB-dependent receptor plug domain-containing protein [Niveispirillum sp. KHB5.9]|uniref:TonB-dependent receptor plug domain-containing protein n=1 Tax=Niveispirillum sp. KHB5.9 TaxID=3400269 RepID=UPI003A85B348